MAMTTAMTTAMTRTRRVGAGARRSGEPVRDTRATWAASTGSGEPGFADPEGLRHLLLRVHDAGPDAWRDDREVAALMRFAMDKYAMLAVKHGRPPQDAATFAWEAMLNDCTVVADDPWAVVTTAVQRALIAEERAEGLLCSAARAARPEYSVFHDATRFAEYGEEDPAVFHHALQVTDPALDGEAGLEVTGSGSSGCVRADDGATVRTVRAAIRDVDRLLRVLGWDAEVARSSLVYICRRLMDEENRASA